jgi:hypothetical protein
MQNNVKFCSTAHFAKASRAKGSVAERLKAPVSKTGIGETLSEVRILPLPQFGAFIFKPKT